MEYLDINNIVEVQEIKELICHRKDLLIYFNELIDKINTNINNNDEKRVNYKVEDSPNDELLESILESDHSSDEDY